MFSTGGAENGLRVVASARDSHHARVFEGVAKSQFPPHGSRFQKWKACPGTLLNGFTTYNTLAWQGCSLNRKV